MNERRVLIVDDDQFIQRSVCSALDRQGCWIERVRTGREGMEALSRCDYDLVITEMNTGEITGLKLLEKAKSLKPEMPVVIMTSCCDGEMMRYAFRSGVDDYFFKNEVREAGSRISSLLQRSPTGRGTGPVGPISSALKENILDMLMVMSHDIRGPLVAIAAALKLLKRGAYGSIDQSVENTLTDLYGRVVALIGLAEEFLGKAALVNAATDLTKKEMDLRQDIIDPVLDELYDDIHKFHIRIDNRLGSIPGNRITVMASKMWLKAVYRNLFRNAIKYGGEGCTIAFGFEDHGSYSKFNVYNTGRSIPKESNGQLFTQFGRLENGWKANIDGVGLGLYLIKQIISKHGGDIWYAPESGGSNFVFTLPKDDHRVGLCAMTPRDRRQKIA
jgi:signal transduction histidine kinase